MIQILIIFHVVIAALLILLVLLQQGKGATAGVAFGGGASQTVFGSRGASSFLMRLTGGLAILFFATSIGLGYLASHQKAITQIPAMPLTSQQQTSQPKTTTKATKTEAPKQQTK